MCVTYGDGKVQAGDGERAREIVDTGEERNLVDQVADWLDEEGDAR
jgi:hypothetical protein